MPCPIAAAAPDGYVLSANAVWHRLAQAGPEHQRSLGDLFPDAAGAAGEALRGGGTVSRRALPLAERPGSTATWWDLDLVPHPNAAGVVLVTARDVTDHVLARREAEDARAALDQTSMRFHLAQEAAGIGTWDWHDTADRQAWSSQQYRLYGLDPEKDMPPSYAEWLDMVHPEDRNLIVAPWPTSDGNREDGSYLTEFRIRRRDNLAERWILSLGRVMERAPNGAMRRVLGVNLDITDRRNEEQAKRQYETLLRIAADAGDIYAWAWDLGTGQVTWGEGLEKALGLPPGGFAGTFEAFRTLVHPDDAPRVEAEVRRALEGAVPGYRATFRMIRTDGSIRWTETRGTVIRDRHGKPLRLIGMDHDITELKATEDALRVREAQQAAVAQLGQFALGEATSLQVMQKAVEFVAETLDVELAKILELQPDNETLLLRAGVGWSAAYPVGRATVPAGRQSQAGYTLMRDNGPVIVADLRTETRFSGPALLLDHGVISGMSVIIHSAHENGRPYGVLGGHTARRRSFTDHDIRFLEAVANVVSSSLQREAAEAVIHARQGRLALFVERAPAGIAMFDNEMRYLAASRRFVIDHQMPVDSPADLIGCDHYTIFPYTPVAWRDVHRRVLAGETIACDDDSFVRLDGKIEYVRWEMTPWRHPSGAIGGAILHAEVVTAQKLAEAALAASEARFRALTEAVPHMVYMSSPDGFSDYRNQRWYDYSGQTREEAYGGGWTAVIHPDDRDATFAAWHKAVATGQLYEHEHRLRARDGSYRWFLSRAVPLPDESNGKVHWIGTTTDISEIVQAREAAAQMTSLLETRVAERTRALTEAAVELQEEMRRRQEAQGALLQSQKLEALGVLTAGVAHDFNNLLMAIQGVFEMTRRHTTDERLVKLTNLGMEAVERATSLSRQLLDFGRSESLQPAVIDVATALHRANQMIGHALGSGIRRVLTIEPDVWPVLTDGHQLEIALLNLAINARDAMAESGTLTVTARNLPPAEWPETLPFRQYVEISVRDTGSGMPPDVLARAMEPFFTTKSAGRGTGLGLPMVQAFTGRSGGCLRIESRMGDGTDVRIILPRAAVTGLPWSDATPRGASSPVSEPGAPTILLVDDDDLVRQIAASYLRRCGYIVLEAPNAETAIVLNHSIDTLDLLLTDVSMPGAQGPELVERIRAERPGLPIIFMTGYSDQAGLADQQVLLKPFDLTDLARAVSYHFAGSLDGTHAALVRRMKHPALVAAYLFWRAARTGYHPPSLADLDWHGLPDADHAFTTQVEAADGSLAFRVLKLGRALQARLGRSLENETIASDSSDEVLGTLGGAYRRCALTLSPSYEYARFSLGDGPPVLFERLILPVSDDGERVTHLVGIAMFNRTL